MNFKNFKNCFIEKEENNLDVYNQCRIKSVCRDDIADMFANINYDRAGECFQYLVAEGYLKIAESQKWHKLKRHYEVINAHTNYIVKEYVDRKYGLNLLDKERSITIIGNRTIVKGFGRQDRIKHKPQGAVYTGWNSFAML